ncbi:hypothetical protein [Vibrio mediterranei]|uniref:hypothetical protein n=1 Tax=Vibrio mediterranei TaxID=689 RepID=UPI004067A537
MKYEDHVDHFARTLNQYVDIAFFEERDIEPREAFLVAVEVQATQIGLDLDHVDAPQTLKRFVSDIVKSLSVQQLSNAEHIIPDLPSY